MRKSLLLIASVLLMTVVSCGELKIVMNRVEKDGDRDIATSSIPFFSCDNVSFEIGAGAKLEKKDTLFGIVLVSDSNVNHGIFSVGSRLMIRLDNNEEIILSNLLDKEFDSHTETNVATVPNYGFAYAYSPWCPGIYVSPYTAYSFTNEVYTTTVNNSYALYLITREQILKIIDHRVIKLRVEIDNQDCDMPNPERTSDYLYRIFDLVRETVRTPAKSTEF